MIANPDWAAWPYRTRSREHHACLGRWIWLTVWMLTAPANGLRGAEPEGSSLPDVFRPENLLWEVELGTHQYTIPRIDGGRVFIGINDTRMSHPAAKRTGGGVLMCLDQATGQMLWQQVIPRYMEGTQAPFHFDQWKCGVCSRPAVDGKRLYIVGPRGEVLCLDRNGQADGNDGPFQGEKAYMGVPADSSYELTAQDGDLIWRFDLIKQLSVVPHDVCGSTPLVYGNYVYACTSNGVDDQHKNVANPEAPSLIALHKVTGQLAACDGEQIGHRLFHGLWSSPVLAIIKGKEMILFGGGDGILYAFAPVDPALESAQPATLKKIWQHDCCPADYRQQDGQTVPYSRWNKKTTEGPSEIITTPVVDQNRIYVAIGQSPIHGPGQGMLSCIDGATGQTLWESREVGRTLSEVLIHDGLAYITDYAGRLHCLEAETGKHLWQQELEGGVWTCSPMVVEGKIYVSTEERLLWILKAGREKEVLARSHLQAVAITPVVHDAVLYLPTQYRLYAIKLRP
jgi:outer membrane protein assembly factor BamB